MRETVSKRFVAMKQRFILDIYDDETDVLSHREFRTLKEFTDALGGDLTGADLTKYRPDKQERSALISAGAFVEESMKPNILPATILGAEITDVEVFYITDLHLDIKIRSLFGENRTLEGTYFINSVVDRLSRDMGATYTPVKMAALAIGGDVAADMDVVRDFYREVGNRFHNAFTVLGNHEFWDSRAYGDGDPVDGCVRAYTEMLAEFKVHLLHNSLLVCPFNRSAMIMSEEQILHTSVEEIRAFTVDSRLTVFGTTGFAALDDVRNAESGMYHSAITSRKREVMHSARADAVYRKLMEALSDQPVLVLSHMPLRSWTTAGYVPQWTYIHGHEHQNNVVEHDGAIDYGDNQVGYGGIPRLKNMLLHGSGDFFRLVPDGIHRIVVSDYLKFMMMRGMNVISCNLNEVVMLKRDGLYMFLVETPNGLRILDGGKRLKATHDIQYYYDSIPCYADAVRRFASEYGKAIWKVSETVMKMGGEGRIHGCIVDIDFYNHLFLNPFDGKLTPYHATSMTDKFVYPSVEMLVAKKCPSLKPKFKDMVKAGEYNLPAVDIGSKKPVYYPETDIYRISRLMYKVQHLTGRNVIRQWNDSFLDLNDPDAPRLAVKALIGDGK